MIIRWAMLIAAMLLPLPAVAGECNSWPIERVIDGDTFRATVNGKSTSIRIISLDTPELKGKCDRERKLAKAAKARLEALTANGARICIEDSRTIPYPPPPWDKRSYGHVFVAGRDVREVLIAEGLGREYRGKREGWCDQ